MTPDQGASCFESRWTASAGECRGLTNSVQGHPGAGGTGCAKVRRAERQMLLALEGK